MGEIPLGETVGDRPMEASLVDLYTGRAICLPLNCLLMPVGSVGSTLVLPAGLFCWRGGGGYVTDNSF